MQNSTTKKYYYCWKKMLFFDIQKQSPRGVLKKGVLRNFAKFTGKHLCQRLFLNNKAPFHRTAPVAAYG